MRIGAALAALGLASCGGGEGNDAAAGGGNVEQAAASAAPIGDDGSIECAIAGRSFARDCTLEQREGPGGLMLTIRNGDGGFRRLLLPRDGSGAVAADGAERARVTVVADGRAEVAIGGDRYRLPAAIGPGRR